MQCITCFAVTHIHTYTHVPTYVHTNCLTQVHMRTYVDMTWLHLYTHVHTHTSTLKTAMTLISELRIVRSLGGGRADQKQTKVLFETASSSSRQEPRSSHEYTNITKLETTPHTWVFLLLTYMHILTYLVHIVHSRVQSIGLYKYPGVWAIDRWIKERSVLLQVVQHRSPDWFHC